MSDASANGETENGAAQPAAQLPKMQILGQFIRDLSFENAAVQNAVVAQGQPDIQVQVALDARKRTTENQYDVIMKLKVESKTKEDEPKSVFLIELEYGGVFSIENIAEQQLHPFLMIECPRMLFPFVRRIISDVTRDGGYPPLNLDQIDFVALYRQQLQQRQAQQAAGEPQGTA
ncbi:protein-export chaperone SecB [Gymnodinialimonas hymeniacidonis]|uniref:protein-export chaperone SecB n=1 Tax=Gymnodinialimonas hymeniacidonis TaxID=3126508 RepID=UPI0034C64EB6